MPSPVVDAVRGHLDLERTAHGLLPHRLPTWARRQIPDEQLKDLTTVQDVVNFVTKNAGGSA